MITKESNTKDIWVVTSELWGREERNSEADAIELVKMNGRIELSSVLKQFLNCTRDGRTNEYREMQGRIENYSIAKTIHGIYERYHTYFEDEMMEETE